MKTLELTSDVVFKSFMLSDNTKNYKARLFSLITGIKEEDLKKAKYTSQELKNANKNHKTYKTDIIVEVDNHIINIEMNKEYYDGVIEKNSSYYSKLRSEILTHGDNYVDLKKIIQINIDDFHKYKGNKLIYEFKMREKDTLEVEDEFVVSYHVDLKYLDGKCYNEEEIERLLRIFTEENIDSLRGDKIMDEAIDELERISRDTGIIGLYDAEVVERKVYNSKMMYAEKIGMEKGMKKGMKKGMEKGFKQRNKEIVNNMLKENMPIDIICKITGLNEKEINDLKD